MNTRTNTEAARPAQEASLAARIQAGDRSAEEELFKTYQRSVLLIATARTHDHEAARDLTQEVFIVVLGALREGRLREHDKLAAFIHGTTRNLVNNFLRTRTRHGECELDEASAAGGNMVEELESAERQRLVNQEIASCSPVDQQILLWSLVDGRSLAEIAERLEMSHEAVRARKSRLVRKMTKKLSKLSHKL